MALGSGQPYWWASGCSCRPLPLRNMCHQHAILCPCHRPSPDSSRWRQILSYWRRSQSMPRPSDISVFCSFSRLHLAAFPVSLWRARLSGGIRPRPLSHSHFSMCPSPLDTSRVTPIKASRGPCNTAPLSLPKLRERYLLTLFFASRSEQWAVRTGVGLRLF